MRNFSTPIFSILFFSVLSSCSEVNEEIESSLDITIPFDRAKPLILEDFVSDQSYVLLSTDKEALYSQADKLIAKQGKFYLFDHLGNTGVLVFDGAGNFLQKVGDFGEGPTQLRGITDFQVSENGEIQVLDQQLRSIITYSAEGVWKKKRKSHLIQVFFLQWKDRWFFAPDRFNQNEEKFSDHKLAVLDANMNTDSLYFHYATDSENANIYYHAGVLSTGDNHLIYHRPPDDTIRVFDRNGTLSNTIVIDFGENTLPLAAVNDFLKMQEYKQQEVDFRYLQTPALMVRNDLFGLISSSKNQTWTYIIDLNSKSLYTQKINLSQLHVKDVMISSANMGDTAIASMIDPMTFTQDAFPEKYPAHVIAHLENEGTVLLINQLKNKDE